MESIRYVAAFRTNAWDNAIAELARRFFAATPHARQVVLVDETRGSIEVPDYEKISHTVDTAFPGLPNYPQGGSLWYNADYVMYALHRALPDYEHYLLSESDLAVNLTLEPMMRHVLDHRIDVLAHHIVPSTPNWFWHSHGVALSAKPWRSLLFFMVLSRRAIETLLSARLKLAQRFADGDLALWPFCEAFVPTILKSTRGMRFAEASKFADTEHLVFRPRLSIHDARANRPGSLAHSVLSGKRFIAALLASYPPRDFFLEESELREGLISQIPFENITEPLRRALARSGDHDGIVLLYDQAAEHGWSVPRTIDLALCKPAITSSLSPWSRYPDTERDARGANGDKLPYEYGFHTGIERSPWWMVDLLFNHTIEEVAIVNRRTHAHRFNAFYIETSCDGKHWTARFEQVDSQQVSSDAESPWRLHFAEPFSARYLRIVLLGKGALHLRRVQIFGGMQTGQSGAPSLEQPGMQRPWPAGPRTDLALCKPAIVSSVSPWSRSQDPEAEASGANGEALLDDFGFHTATEVDPWWMVDLLGEHFVEEVALVNRKANGHRFRRFRIETSCNGEAWTAGFTQTDPINVSANPAVPWTVRFADPFVARFLRVALLGTEPFHLRRVQVFGRALPDQPLTPLPFAEFGQSWFPGPVTDLAYCKPAVASSVSQWSRDEDPERDAAGANSEALPPDFGFHTRKEASPWWMVDLLGAHLVEEVTITNRVQQLERFRTFCIEVSTDGENWTTRFIQTAPNAISSNADAPWSGRFAAPALARYLRIVLSGTGPLHLRRVQVFGRALLSQPKPPPGYRLDWPAGPSADLALLKPATASSVSPWKRYESSQAEAGATNGESLPDDCGFHTCKGTNPWWMVDLLDEYRIEEVAIVNRAIQQERFSTFYIETSTEGDVWIRQFTLDKPLAISADPAFPWRIRFDEPLRGRYLRIVVLGSGPLHLRRVQVLGRAVIERTQSRGCLVG